MKIFAPHANAALAPVRSVLFVLRPWELSLGGSRWRDHRKRVAHYRSNPRDAEYMLDRAAEFRQVFAPAAAADLLAELAPGEEIPHKHGTAFNRTWSIAQLDERVTGNGYDTIVFLYADAIGLGWEATEKAFSRIKVAQYVVINGRRRVFLWDGASRRALAWRRRIIRTWWLEVLLVPAVLVAAAVFAGWDALTGATRDADSGG